MQSFVQDVYDRYVAAAPGDASRAIIAKVSSPQFTQLLQQPTDVDRVVCAQNIPESLKVGAARQSSEGFDVPVTLSWGASADSNVTVHVIREGDALRVDGIACSA